MKLIRFPRLSLSFPLLLLGVVVLPLLLEDRNTPATGDLSTVPSSATAAEDVPGESGDKGGEQQEGQDTGTPVRPHAAAGICEEALQVGVLQAESVARQLSPGDPGSSLSWWNGALYPLELNTGFSSCTLSYSSSCIPAGVGRVNHPVRGPPAI